MKLTYLTSAILTAFSIGVAAQEPPKKNKNNAKIERIVVTAQKRVESVQDIGISMSAFNDTDLADMNIGESVDIAGQIPNVQVNYGFGQNSFSIRGIGINEYAANNDAPVATHIDEIYQSKSFMITLGIFDVQRIEVLKGPQGTLFGRNTTGGSVNFITNKPSDDFEAAINYSFGSYNTHKAEAFISDALSENVAGRLSGFVTKQNKGVADNTINGKTDDIGKIDEMAMRGQLAWELDETSVLLTAHYGKDKSELFPYQAIGAVDVNDLTKMCPQYLDGTITGATLGCINPVTGANEGDTDPFTSQQNLYPKNNNTAWGTSLHVDMETSFGQFTSITAFESFERDFQEDADNTPIRSIDVYYYNEIEQFTQEFRLAVEGDNYHYLVGLFYERDDYVNLNALDLTDHPAFGFITNNDFVQNVDALAAFVHSEFNLTNELQLIAGLRYTDEKTVFNGQHYVGGGEFLTDVINQHSSEVIAVLATSDNIDGGNERNDSNLSYKLGLEWSVANDMLLYTSLSTGFRSGGFNGGFPFTQAELTSFEAEEMTAYEIGFKSTLADGQLQFNASTFLYDYENLQVNVDIPGSLAPATTNAADSRTIGAEFDLYWKPNEQWDIKLGAGYLDAEFNSDLFITAGGTNLKGSRPPNSPKFTLNTMRRYKNSIGNKLNIRATTNISWRDEQHLETENKPSNLVDAYSITDVRITLFPDSEEWEVSVWGKNVFDEQYITYVNDLPSFGLILNIYGAPATYGISVNYKWN